ncbi:MAG: hypothetical protein WCA84_16415 [Ignavibacteriaceae bacterium]
MADQVNLLKGNLIKLSFSPNDIASEYCYRQFAELTDAAKIKICLEKKLLTEDDVEDGLFTRDELTDLLYNNMKVKELVEMNGWMDVSRRLIRLWRK